jgi:hypothetical protein
MSKYTKIQIFSVFLFVFSLFLNSRFFSNIFREKDIYFDSWEYNNILWYDYGDPNYTLANYLVVLSILLFIYSYLKKDEY